MPRNKKRASGSSGEQKQQSKEVSKKCESGTNCLGVNTKETKSRKSRRKKKTSETKTESNNSKDNHTLKMPSLTKTESSNRSKDVQNDALRKTTALSSYKIPKKKVDESKNSAITAVAVLKAQPVKIVKSVSLSTKIRSIQTLNNDERKRKSDDPSDTYTGSQKRCPSVRTAENVVSETTLPSNTQIRENSTLKTSSPDSRPKLSAKRRILPADSHGVSNRSAQNVVIDTPQMAMVKAEAASRNANKEGKKKPTNYSEKNKKIKAEVNVPASNCPSSTVCRPDVGTFGTATPTHAAASEISDVLELVRNGYYNGEMDTTDAMDVDIIQSVLPSKSKQLMIVLDTNVWISNQDLITEILELNFPSSPPATLILPWMVLQEIDHKKNSAGAAKFRSASKFIYDLLSKKHPRVKAQKATEALIGMEFNELMADDSILNCAIQYNKLPQLIAVLVTNDINLLNKALVHGLTAHKADKELVLNLRKLQSEDDSQIIKELEVSADTTFGHSLLSANSFCTPSTLQSSFNSNVQLLNDMEDTDIVMDVDDPMGVEESNYNDTNNVSNNDEDQHRAPTDLPTFETVATALQQTLTSIIVPKMVEEYGKDGWRFAIKVKPPFTVGSGMKCLQAHWIAVFSYLFPARGKEVIDELVSLFQKNLGHANAEEIKTWRLNVCQMAKVLLTVNNEIANKTRVSDCCRLLQEYIHFETSQMQPS